MGKFRKHGSKHDKGPKKKNNKGPKKDAIHGIKAGAKGIAAQYLTRAQSLKKLQLSLVDFRRLCILKGIYPRDPKKKPQGNDKTYYHVKDIRFLQHEPLLMKFFELKTYMKKYKKCLGRGDKNTAKRVQENKPEYTLHHLVRERYPTFSDAIRDLDDSLSMVALYDCLPTDQKNEIRGDVVQESARLVHEFFLYVIQTKSLKKCFASIKGYYFQADIQGETVTWLVPHKYTQELPAEVDFRVMGTFNEFYRTMLKFINFKLFAEAKFEYPPKFNYKRDAADMAKFYVKNADSKKVQQTEEQRQNEKREVEAATIQDFAAVSEEVQQLQLLKQPSSSKGVFSGMRVFIQREVPFHSIYFVLKSGGAEVGWSLLPASPFKENDKKITHQIIDRPSSQFTQIPGREYVQPQWVLDSFNENLKLPVDPYLPDKICPPHLSPFVDDKEEGYVPERREILNKLLSGGSSSSSSFAGAEKNVNAADKNDEEIDHEAQFLKELQAEAKGVWASEFARQKEAEDDDDAEDDGSSTSAEENEEAEDAASNKPEAASSEMMLKNEDDTAGPGAAEKAAAAAGTTSTAPPVEKKLTKAEREAAEDLARRKAMMPKKHQRLLQRIEKTEKDKVDKAVLLTSKRKELKKGGKKKKQNKA